MDFDHRHHYFLKTDASVDVTLANPWPRKPAQRQRKYSRPIPAEAQCLGIEYFDARAGRDILSEREALCWIRPLISCWQSRHVPIVDIILLKQEAMISRD